MGEERGKGLWIGLAGLALAAIVFLALWFMRGSDLDRLTTDLGSSRTTVRRLEDELRGVRSEVDASHRRVTELENQVREETRRLTEASGQLERRLRADLDLSARRLASANAELDRLREKEKTATAETTELRDLLDQARKDLEDVRSAGAKELDRLNRQLVDANSTIRDLDNRLETGNASLRTLEQALKSTRGGAGEAAASELTELRNELAKAALALSETRNANAVLEEMRGRLAATVESDKAAAITREQELMRTIEELSARIEGGAQDSFAISAAVPNGRDREIVALKQEVSGYQRKISELEIAGEHAAASAAGASASAAEWKNRAESLEKELADWKSRASTEAAAIGDSLRARLDTVEREFEDFRERSAAEAKAADESWRESMAKAEKELEVLRADSAAQAERMEADLASRADAAGKELAEFRARAAAEAEALKSRLAAKDGELAAKTDELAAKDNELAAAGKRVVEELAALKRGHEANLRSLESDFQARLNAVRQEASDRLADNERRSAERISELATSSAALQADLRREIASRDARIGELEESGRESAKRIILLRNAFTRQVELMREAAARHEKEKEELREDIAGLEKSLADVSPGGVKFAPFPVGRSVGKIIGRMPDGQTLVIDAGVEQRIKPGMKFDVFRPVGEGNRYAGMIKVIRVLGDASLAISSYAEVNGLVCPVTGRAVLEPDAKYSPYAVDKDGMPVKLTPADTVGIPLEAPAIGDSIDNPFYDPSRQVRFAISPELAGDPCIVAAIEALGGAPRTGGLAKEADFIVTPNADSEPDAPASGPRRVTIGHLARYLDPAPAR